ncbi:acyl-CoA dehydrogenase [Rhodococcus sp. NPDC127530]|uniref:acyl-CoA dehydrogenase n=1 Tax=unclassified Rhodococcus (in: high G+C Gram-positive bacteria) TaxID=192944 RepID=UPI0036361EB8
MTDWVQQAQDLTDEVLRPAATEVDRSGRIPLSHFAALRDRGFYGLAFATTDPVNTLAFATTDPVNTLADVGEILVSGCLATAFVWAQHHGTLLRMVMSRNDTLKARYLADLQSGAVRSGVSGSGYANPENPLIVATETDDGYTISGRAPFVTGWGLVDVIGVTAYDTRGQKTVTFLMDATDGPTVHANRICLSAADASNTVALTFNGHHVPHTAVIHVRKARRGGLSIADRAILRINGSLALGVARSCLAEADRIGHPSPQLWETHITIREALNNAATGNGDIYDARARASQFAVIAANYVATAAGSPSVQRGEPAERLVREAAFSMVCTTTPEIKSRILTARTP